MSFLKSLFLGTEGSYQVLGVHVDFVNELPSNYLPPNLEGVGFISKIAFKCLNIPAFRLSTQGYAHVFVNKMSQALTYKIFTLENPTIHIMKSTCTGGITYPSALIEIEDWKKTAVSVAGPIGDIAFSSCKLVAAIAFKKYLSLPAALVIASGSFFWISGELLYAYSSGVNRDTGDFGLIAKRGHMQLALASAALVSECALTILFAIKLS